MSWLRIYILSILLLFYVTIRLIIIVASLVNWIRSSRTRILLF